MSNFSFLPKLNISQPESEIDKVDFFEKNTVPSSLFNYLELEEGTKLNRIEVTEKILLKFKERGILKGGFITLDESTAKLFDKKKGEKFYLFKLQTFLRNIYI